MSDTNNDFFSYQELIRRGETSVLKRTLIAKASLHCNIPVETPIHQMEMCELKSQLEP